MIIYCIRWLRQPLLDHEEINRRLDIVQCLRNQTVQRNQIRDGPLKNIPGITIVIIIVIKITIVIIIVISNNNSNSNSNSNNLIQFE